jgi:hypothetical protein
MGNTKSEQATNYEQHERLGEVKLVQETDREGNLAESMVLARPIESEQAFNRWLQEFNRINDPILSEVLFLPHKTVYESTGMCGSSGLVTVPSSPLS